MTCSVCVQAAEGVRARAAAECGAALLTALSAAPALAGDLFQAMLPALENFTQHADLLEVRRHTDTIDTSLIDTLKNIID